MSEGTDRQAILDAARALGLEVAGDRHFQCPRHGDRLAFVWGEFWYCLQGHPLEHGGDVRSLRRGQLIEVELRRHDESAPDVGRR